MYGIQLILQLNHFVNNFDEGVITSIFIYFISYGVVHELRFSKYELQLTERIFRIFSFL